MALNFGPRIFAVCISSGCANAARKSSAYCDRCVIVRGHHQVSHEMEGHSGDFILHCPICERLAQIKSEKPPPAFL